MSNAIGWCCSHNGELFDDRLSQWNEFSGRKIDRDSVDRITEKATAEWLHKPALAPLRLDAPTPTCEVSTTRPKNGRLSAVLFGYGNEAKIMILKHTDSQIEIRRIHEIEPTQIGPTQIHKHERFEFDTSPCFRPGEQYDVSYIAGYHHTHAQLAIDAISRGGYAVVEKPIVTTRIQLNNLIDACRENRGRIFCCFQMRYNPLFALVHKDLKVEPGSAIHYYATVFAVRLPERHWYLWPNSCSHVIRNACHWLDHFLYLNEYSPVTRQHIQVYSNGDSQIGVELENGAVLGLLLTHEGSERIGLHDHIEFRVNERTITVDTASKYIAESPKRVIRRARTSRALCYQLMYREISRKILNGEAGDSLRSLIATNTLMLDLEEQRQQRVVNLH